jgi:hypothetical protein
MKKGNLSLNTQMVACWYKTYIRQICEKKNKNVSIGCKQRHQRTICGEGQTCAPAATGIRHSVSEAGCTMAA